MNILIIEDEQALQESIRDYFASDSIHCETAANFQSGMEKANAFDYDCIILDLNLPGGSGLDILRQVKNSVDKPNVLIITANNSFENQAAASALGADGYLPKPFHLSELKARTLSIIYKNGFQGSHSLTFREIAIDLLTMEVKVKQKEIGLNHTEDELLLFFMENHGNTVMKEVVADHILESKMASMSLVDIHIAELNKKLLEAGSGDYVNTVFGIAYRFS